MQESLLLALRKVCVHMKMATLVTNSTSSLPSPHTITSVLLTQCRKKQNRTYQTVAIETLGGLVSTLEVDVLSEFCEIAYPLILPVRFWLPMYYVLSPSFRQVRYFSVYNIGMYIHMPSLT